MTDLSLHLGENAAKVLEAAKADRLLGPEPYRLQLVAEHLALIAGFDELVGLERLGFQPFDYQIRAAQTVLRRFRGRGLLCDEVGLGKTIEAGLVLQEYLTRQMASGCSSSRRRSGGAGAKSWRSSSIFSTSSPAPTQTSARAGGLGAFPA
jgi:hypothetical protein